MKLLHCWLIITLAVSLVMASVAPRAQPRATIPRVGVLEPGFPQMAAEPWTCLNGFRQGLRDLGYVEDHTILLDSRYAEGQAERLPALAAALIQLAPDVLWTHSIEAARTIRQVTTAVPIVVGVTGADLVEEGLVTSLARPNGNRTRSASENFMVAMTSACGVPCRHGQTSSITIGHLGADSIRSASLYSGTGSTAGGIGSHGAGVTRAQPHVAGAAQPNLAEFFTSPFERSTTTRTSTPSSESAPSRWSTGAPWPYANPDPCGRR
jgi:hypothetical protein